MSKVSELTSGMIMIMQKSGRGIVFIDEIDKIARKSDNHQ
jgi:ATP-dependent protease Clp ATPase subunit